MCIFSVPNWLIRVSHNLPHVEFSIYPVSPVVVASGEGLTFFSWNLFLLQFLLPGIRSSIQDVSW